MTRATLEKDPAEVAAMFDEVAPRYDLTNAVLSLGQDRGWRTAVRDALALRPGERVLDLAAGTATSSAALARSGADVVGCDFSLGMLRVGARAGHRGVELVAGDALRLPFADGAFDLVVTRIAPHHFEDIAAAVAELARVSNDLVVVEDTLYAGDQVEEAEQLRDPTHVRSYSEEEWRSFLEAAGLEIEQVETFEKRHPLEEWLDRAGTPDGDRARVKELLADRIEDGEYVDTKLVLRARKAA